MGEVKDNIALQVDGLRKEFRSRKKRVLAVDGVSFAVRSGEVYGFLGPNGAGKTTTIKMICGLVTPDEGSARIAGADIRTQRRDALREVGAVLEGNRNTYWRYTPIENLRYFATLKGKRIPKLMSRIEFLLKFFDLWEKRSDTMQTLSRGMQQKVAIACALIHDPQVLLLDEPTLGLDVQAAHLVKEQVKELADKYGKTIVLTTHQMDVAQEICDRIAIINNGRIVVEDTTRNLISLFSYKEYDFEFSGDCASPLEPLAGRWSGSSVEQRDGATILRLTFRDMAQLYQALDEFRARRLPLASITKVEPNLADVFIRIVSGEKQAAPERGEAQ